MANPTVIPTATYVSITVGQPTGLAFGSTGTTDYLLVVTSNNYGMLANVTNPASIPAPQEVLTSSSGLSSPSDVVWANGWFYVANAGANTVKSFDPSTSASYQQLITGLSTPVDLVYDPSNSYLYISNATGQISVYLVSGSASTSELLITIATPGGEVIANGNLYVSNGSSSGGVDIVPIAASGPATGASLNYLLSLPYSPTYFQVQASYDGWTSPWSAAVAS